MVTPQLHARVMREVILPTIKGMQAEGITYTGFLYAGLMIDAKGQVKTLEFNCRMGDPETQPIIVRLKSDLVDLLLHAVEAQHLLRGRRPQPLIGGLAVRQVRRLAACNIVAQIDEQRCVDIQRSNSFLCETLVISFSVDSAVV